MASVKGERERLDGIDLVRGLVMVLMALDHARDYFGDIRLQPEDLSATTPVLFFTRFVTHFCAPVFVLLAGGSAYLYGSRGRSRGELSRFLLTRGLWLVALEVTVVFYGWAHTFTLGPGLIFLQVIAAIGAGMVVLSGLVWLPGRVVLAVGLAIVVGHDTLHGIEPGDLGPLWPVWSFLHEAFAVVPVGGKLLMVLYPLLPWIGVIALGYGLGPLLAEHRPRLLPLGLAACVAFAVLRGLNLYGDPTPWQPQETAAMAVVSFLNCTKYPPSLQFLLMTLGPALVLLGVVRGARGPVGRALVTFGRVPLFFYVLHIYLIHGASRLLYRIELGEWVSPMQAQVAGSFPEGFGHGLGTVYAAWIAVVLVLWLPCVWYARVKRTHRSRILSYL